MKIEIKREANFIEGSIAKDSLPKDLSEWTEILRKFLQYALHNRKVYLFTLSPMKYSLGYELGNLKIEKFGKSKVLINYFDKCTDAQITQIVNSAEFERGLLKIVLADEQKSFRDLRFVKGDYSNLEEELLTCEADGYNFYWYNPRTLHQAAELKFREIASPHIGYK